MIIYIIIGMVSFLLGSIIPTVVYRWDIKENHRLRGRNRELKKGWSHDRMTIRDLETEISIMKGEL